ncbi:hypothetical protein Pelo_8018 [Pelomyxa schiedti]|nr:hypothetical protein Pelo_8018 [Pelomyxa schiedti]
MTSASLPVHMTTGNHYLIYVLLSLAKSKRLTKAQIDKLLLCSRLPQVGRKLGSHDNYLMYAPLPKSKRVCLQSTTVTASLWTTS